MSIQTKVKKLLEQKVKERVAESRYDSDDTPLPSEMGASPADLYGKFDPENKEQFLNKLAKIISGESKSGYKKLSEIVDEISRTDTEALKERLFKIKPSFEPEKKSGRVIFHIINIELSKRGVAPRWRRMTKPVFKVHDEWTEGESSYLRDLQVYDMEWLHRNYPEHRVVGSYNGIFKQLQSGKKFDYAQAQMIAAAEITAAKKAEIFKLTKDMQAEMFVIKEKAVERWQYRLLKKLEQVEVDLVLAANRNPRRGKKLLNVLDDRKNIWLSCMMTKSNSESVMVENYLKLTGKKINRSTFKSKLQSLNRTLEEVGSKNAF